MDKNKGNHNGPYIFTTPLSPWRYGTAKGYNDYNRSSIARKNSAVKFYVATALSIIAFVHVFACNNSIHHNGNSTKEED